MFDTPTFDFTWTDLYEHWKKACQELNINPSVNHVLTVEIEEDTNFAEELDWIPLASAQSKIGPKQATYKGISYLTTHAPNPSLLTASLILQYSNNREQFACLSIYACAFQLYQCFPPYWRGIYNHSFLRAVCDICATFLEDSMRWHWSVSSRKIFPNKFFSPLLLECISWLTESQLIKFAVLNMDYYLKNWVIVRYWYGMPFDKYQLKKSLLDNFNGTSLTKNEAQTQADLDVNKTSERRSRPTFNKDKHAEEKKKPYVKSVRTLIKNQRDAKPLSEGERKQRTYDAIERNGTARKICLNHYGYVCQACGLDFQKRFGSEFANIIDVHHLNPISKSSGSRMVDPLKDLIPLCPNCHRMIHKGTNEPLTLDELKQVLNQSSLNKL